MYAPIVVIAFNRPEVLKSTLCSLANNKIAKESDLYVFVDGPRKNKDGEKEKVDKVIEVAKSVTGFKKIDIRLSVANKGLAESIIRAATEILYRCGKIILVEDDLYVSPSFLAYMNEALEKYKDDYRIMQVTGFSARIRNYQKYRQNCYLTHRAHSWSWGTWKDRWETVDWEVKDFDELAASKEKQKAFCEYGSDLYGMLRGWKTGKNNSWFIRFNYSMHKQGKFSVAPIRSLIRNDGFGADATHCNTYNRYKIDFMFEEREIWNLPERLEWNKKLDKESVRYWSIFYRIYGKIMGIIRKSWI
mgnify:CR=1 FL=1